MIPPDTETRLLMAVFLGEPLPAADVRIVADELQSVRSALRELYRVINADDRNVTFDVHKVCLQIEAEHHDVIHSHIPLHMDMERPS